MARSRLEGESSIERQKQLLDRFRVLIDSMSQCGEKSEFECVYLLRTWIFEKNLSHLVSVELGMPHEDYGDQKVDFRLHVAGAVNSFQLKTEVEADAYRKEHYDAVAKRAMENIKGTNTKLVFIDTPTLIEAYEKSKSAQTKEDRAVATRTKHALLDRLMEALDPEDADILSRLTDRKPKTSEKGKRLTEAFVMNSAHPMLLEQFGLLVPGVRTPQEILQAKKTFDSTASNDRENCWYAGSFSFYE
jgi:hypothetical protein